MFGATIRSSTPVRWIPICAGCAINWAHTDLTSKPFGALVTSWRRRRSPDRAPELFPNCHPCATRSSHDFDQVTFVGIRLDLLRVPTPRFRQSLTVARNQGG